MADPHYPSAAAAAKHSDDDPVKLEPSAWYSDKALAATLGCKPDALKEARTSGKLRYTEAAGVPLSLGDWINRWLNGAATPEPANG